MSKIKIFVVTHKPCDVYQDGVYIPIHVGRANSMCTDQMGGMIGDDTGDNISIKNPRYCELTAQYWAWKNIKNIDYIGFCHYRRYFKTKYTDCNIDAEMSGYDAILVKCIKKPITIVSWSCNALEQESIYIFIHYLYKSFPMFRDKIDNYFLGNICFPCNMFIMKKELFDQFAQWQFSILSDLEGLLRFSPYSRLNRMLGYVAEHLPYLYATFYNLKIKEEPIVGMLGNDNELFKSTFWASLKNRIKFYMSQKSFCWDDSVIIGLKNDGIYDKLY